MDSGKECNIFIPYDNKILEWDEKDQSFKLNLNKINYGDQLLDTISKRDTFYIKSPITKKMARVQVDFSGLAIADALNPSYWIWTVHYEDKIWQMIMVPDNNG